MRVPNDPLRLARRHAGRLLALSLLLGPALASSGLSGAAFAAAPGPEDTVRSFYDTLLDTMRNGPSLGDRGRYEKLAPVIGQVFDIPYMAQMAVGPTWASLTPAQKQQLIEAFGRYVAATYAERFDDYSGEQFRVTGEQPYGSGVVVQSQIVKSDGEPVSINYLMRKDGDTWRVADVYLTGTISEVATERSEFSSVLRRQGVDGLIAMLNRKADTLVANNVRR
jgi:phospholipid transport system substrate-binding protein